MVAVIVSTSWDDGSSFDGKLLLLLDKYYINGTFYLCKSTTALDNNLIRSISANYEIGGHGLNHSKLTELPGDMVREEVEGSKYWLEDTISRRIRMFCYPYGLYNDGVKKVVQRAGFVGARTAQNFQFAPGKDPFAICVTLQVFPFPVYSWRKHGLMFLIYRNWSYLKNIGRLDFPLSALTSWSKLAIAAFNWAASHGGIWHIWGHSWEIEKYDMWLELEKVLKYVAKRPDCVYVTNEYLVELIKKGASGGQ